MDKHKLRKQLTEQRKNKAQEYIYRNSEIIVNKVSNLSLFQDSMHPLFYVSTNNEVCTHQLIKKVLSSKKKVYVPLSEIKTHTLKISKLSYWDDLIPGTYNILEPKKEKQKLVPINTIDVIIVPGIGFDKKGNRLGQGGGYYDWLLSQTNATAIALAFEFQLLNLIPMDSHDQQVDIIITEKQVIHCGKD